MPLVNLGDLKGLSPIAQGRKVYDAPVEYAGKVVKFLLDKYPHPSP